MQIARLVTASGLASNLENHPFIEFPERTNGPGLGCAEPLHAIVGVPMLAVQWPQPIRIRRP
jgi:hypothetical protein